MGVRFAEGVILNVEEMWKESNIRVPMVCFLSMGSDPTNTIDMLSRKLNLSKFSLHGILLRSLTSYLSSCLAFGSVSMGQGQEVHARRLISQCQQQVGNLTSTCSLAVILPSTSLHCAGRLGSAPEHSLGPGLPGRAPTEHPGD